ncbi:hypothetical protein M4S82_03955 [Planococcus sp. MERTA32b]|nr:hypothetical protein [Planococcus sp. MER TA 32b]
MRIFVFNKDFSEQSVRQVETLLSFLDISTIVLDYEWEKVLSNSKIEYTNFEEFHKRPGLKGILFLNILDGNYLMKYKNKNTFYIFRPRGIVPEESYYKKKNLVKREILNFIERKVIKRVDYFIFLSDTQKAHYFNKYKSILMNKHIKSTILPNLKISEKSLFKSTVKERSPLKIVYSGGFSKWQNIELVFKTFESLLNVYESVEFSVLTFENNFDYAEKLARKYNVFKVFKVKYVNPEILNSELRKYDVGIIIRDKSIVNSSASPFKVIDYLSNGLGLIVTDSVAEASGLKGFLNSNSYFVIDFNAGKISYQKDNLIKFIEQILNEKTKMNIINSYNNFTKEILAEEISLKIENAAVEMNKLKNLY